MVKSTYLHDYLSIIRWKVMNEEKIKQLSNDKKTAYNNKFKDTYKKADNSDTFFNGVDLDGEKIFDASIFKGCAETKDDVLKLLPKREIDLVKQLAKLGALYTKFKYFPHGIALNISCNSKALLAIYKTTTIASRVILLAQKVGLLKCVNSKYRFGTNKDNYSKQYCLNNHVGKLILDLCTEYKINPEDKYIKRANVIVNDVESKLSIDHIKKTYNLTLGKGRSVPGLTEEEALALLYKQYPQFKDIGEIVNYDNEHYIDRPEQQVRWKFNVGFDKRGFNNKRGFRANSDFCSFKSSEKMLSMGCDDIDVYTYERDVLTPQQKEYREKYVEQYMYEHGVNGNYYHWDMTGSIYFIQYFKKHGVFIPDGVDPYAFMAGVKEFENKEDRNIYKLHAAMQNNFDFSWKAVYAKIKNINGVINPTIMKLDKEHGNIIESETGETLKYSEYLFKHYYNMLFSQMQNKDKNTEIFLDESCIYAKMAHYLRERGFIVLQVYDSFWIGKPNTNYTEGYVNNCLRSLMKHIMIWYFDKYYGVKQPEHYNFFVIDSTIYNNIINDNLNTDSEKDFKEFAEYWFTFTGYNKEKDYNNE